MGFWYRCKAGILTALALLVLGSPSWSQGLVPGDLVFTGYHTDDPEAFAFVPLVDVLPGTAITFTDNVWTGGALRDNETTGVWTAPVGGWPAGSPVMIETGAVVIGGGAWSGDTLALSQEGEQILAYQGSALSPQFLAGISTRQWAAQASEVHNGLSEVPPGLVLGLSALTFGVHRDNARHGFALAAATRTGWLGAIHNQASWQRSNAPLALDPRALALLPPQPLLPPGDIAFVAYSTDQKRVGFVALRALAAGTEILFTDIGYTGVALVPVRGLEEQTVLWVAPAAGVVAGTVVELRSGRASVGRLSGALADLSVAGEQVLAFQGTVTAPHFLAGVSSRHWKAALPIDKTHSLLPAGLSLGETAIGFSSQDVDNGRYGGAMDLGDPDAWRRAIYQGAAWIRSDSIQVWPADWGFPPERGTVFRIQ